MIKRVTVKTKGLKPLDGFVLQKSDDQITMLLATDKSFEYFHLVLIKKNPADIVPICGIISKLELAEQISFQKPKIWQRSLKF